MNNVQIASLNSKISGDLYTDDLHKIIYATDASVYREIPLGVVCPKDDADIIEIVKFCRANKISIIPRAGGTSLAGQCVGDGLVLDVSKYMNKIISIDKKTKTATVQPGVIRDELNLALKSYGLMVGPNTSTANRATLGGMVGNNSCGSTSIVFGNTRDHIKSLQTVMSDGTLHHISALTDEQFDHAAGDRSIIGDVTSFLQRTLHKADVKEEILSQYPKQTVRRRNTGYALDSIVMSSPFTEGGRDFNLCSLLCGSEGTLAITTEITIGLVEIPPPFEALVAIHFHDVNSSLESVPSIMIHQPFACELMDKTILDCTKGQILYEPDRFFLEGDPEAVMLVSFVANTEEGAVEKVKTLVDYLVERKMGYSHPIINERVDKIWNLRKAGLGLLANLPGDKKAVACIEDTAVAIEDLASYIAEFSEIMDDFGQRSVYYAHAGAGEIHLRPILDLKQKKDRQMFHDISLASARLVKKYNGSLSGEHGDGRVRAPFIKEVYGEKIYDILKELKAVFDPHNIFNPGKIVDAPAITDSLRFAEGHEEKTYETTFDFSEVGGVLRAAEKCNGSGDCRKLPLSGGTMCPSYMATRNEKDTTRARANTLREVLTQSDPDTAWDSQELKEVVDLCLSCKGCTSECPSNVDMSSLKAEFLHQYQKKNGIPLRSRLFANFNNLGNVGSKFGGLTDLIVKGKFSSPLLKKVMGVHPKRTLPGIDRVPLKKRYSKIQKKFTEVEKHTEVYFFCDEFTNYNDADIGEIALKFLFRLGYDVKMINHEESGRAAISKGILDMAKSYANKNVETFSGLASEETPLIGIEPSAILSFRDEYPRLVSKSNVSDANKLAKHVFTIEEFIYKEVIKERITSEHFNSEIRRLHLHGHCHQKALTDIKEVAWTLSLPDGYQVDVIPSGCCGMAGSFGYEKEHYEISMQIGELVLFPAVRKADDAAIIVASGTSCRHQIKDGTGRSALHVIEVLWNALRTDNS